MSDAFLSLPTAVADEQLGVAHHFGSPLIEQRSLAEGNAVVSLSHRGIITVTGEDRLSWLNSMTSQHVLGLHSGESVETLLLDPQGRIETVIRLVDDGVTSWLLVDEGAAQPLTDYLTRMRFAMRVEVANVSDRYAAVQVFADGSALDALRKLDCAVCEWHDPWREIQPGGVQYARQQHPAGSWQSTQLVFRREDLELVAQLVRTGSISAAGLSALEALEVAAWRPTQHGEVDERALPHEFDWLRSAVHLNKGCYRGQETVAKVHNLGHPPRRLVLLHLDGSGGELPAPGALVFVAAEGADPEARPVGRITRAATHYEWGGIALALVKRSTPPEATLEVRLGENGSEVGAAGPVVAATQETIVPADAGKTRDIPRLPKL